LSKLLYTGIVITRIKLAHREFWIPSTQRQKNNFLYKLPI
jgi:hypothetical protein